MKTVMIHDIYFETESGDKLRTKVSFTNGQDAMKYIQTENAKNPAFGRYIDQTHIRVCYESYEEFLSAQNNAGIEK